MSDLDDEALKTITMQMVNERGHDAYKKLCDEWEQNPTGVDERLFKAGMGSGIFMALKSVLDSGE